MSWEVYFVRGLGRVKGLWADLGGIIRYYDGGVSSVYFWDLDDGFAGAVLLKKSTCIPWSPNDY